MKKINNDKGSAGARLTAGPRSVEHESVQEANKCVFQTDTKSFFYLYEVWQGDGECGGTS